MSEGRKEAHWVVTLSNGETAVEHTGNWSEIPGERKPWVRLCNYAGKNGYHLTSLRLNIDGKTIHLPKERLSRFVFGEGKEVAPISYSLSYIIEAEMGGDGSFGAEKKFVDLTSHFEDFEVHYVHDITDNNVSWVAVTRGSKAMAESPRRRSPVKADA